MTAKLSACFTPFTQLPCQTHLCCAAHERFDRERAAQQQQQQQPLHDALMEQRTEQAKQHTRFLKAKAEQAEKASTGECVVPFISLELLPFPLGEWLD